jgi:hypothetical protein
MTDCVPLLSVSNVVAIHKYFVTAERMRSYFFFLNPTLCSRSEGKMKSSLNEIASLWGRCCVEDLAKAILLGIFRQAPMDDRAVMATTAD